MKTEEKNERLFWREFSNVNEFSHISASDLNVSNRHSLECRPFSTDEGGKSYRSITAWFLSL